MPSIDSVLGSGSLLLPNTYFPIGVLHGLLHHLYVVMALDGLGRAPEQPMLSACKGYVKIAPHTNAADLRPWNSEYKLTFARSFSTAEGVSNTV